MRSRPKSRAFLREGFLIATAASMLAGCAGGSHALMPDVGRNASNAEHCTASTQAAASSVQPHGGIVKYSLPPADVSTPLDIAAGPDGNLWFTDDLGTIGKITTCGKITEFPVPTTNAYLYGIIAGPDGNLWFAESDKIAKITIAGSVTEYSLPPTYPQADGLAVGRDGNIWFTNVAQIGKIATSGGITADPLPSADMFADYAIVAGSDRNLWFPEYSGGQLGAGKITLGGRVSAYPFPMTHATYLRESSSIAAGPDGNLWVTETARAPACGHCVKPVVASAIWTITTTGKITQHPLAVKAAPGEIIAGSDGNLWFTEAAGIAKITTVGKVTEYPIGTTELSPHGIAAGPDGNIWITMDSSGNARSAIWKINPASQ